MNDLQNDRRIFQVPHSALGEIPFIDAKNVGGRTLATLSFFDEKWHMWIPTPAGFQFILGHPVEGNYFGKYPEREEDIHSLFFDFITQRACWPDTLYHAQGIFSDVLNLSASLAKLDIFHHLSNEGKTEIARMVSTEVEYIFSVCRSIYDLLQETVTEIWKRIKITEENGSKKYELPSSFRRMVMRDTVRMEPDQIADRWGIPLALAEYHFRQAPFFERLREYRDQVAHKGKDLDFLFVTKRGFAVSAETEPFASFPIWNKEHMLPNQLASLRPALAYVITETFRALEEFAELIQQIITFPPEIAPGFKLYMRGHHTKELRSMYVILERCLWWDEDPRAFNPSSDGA